MMNAVIRWALLNRGLTLLIAVLVMSYGGYVSLHAPIDVFPDLNRPRVTLLVEAPGMAPEEVEALITFPLETALNGASDVDAVRSTSSSGLAIVHIEFAYGTDIYNDRQVVNERLALVKSRLPPQATLQLAPISSIVGQILVLGMWSEGESTSPMELRSLADWVVRQRLLTIPGIAQVSAVGGERKQFQVLVDPHALVRNGISLEQVRQALAEANQNATGGYLDQQGPNEILVRALGRLQSLQQLEQVVVAVRQGRPVPLHVVARVMEGPQVKRGDSSAYVRNPVSALTPTAATTTGSKPDLDLPGSAAFSGGPSVLLTINKQPGADTRAVSNQVRAALEQLRPSLPADVRLEVMYSQEAFIERAINNVLEALRDGVVLVSIILILFLMNVRTTLITLTAIPLSLMTTAIVFAWVGMSINTMTLGGLAVALGELVDDAIVDVENIFRRLKENARLDAPLPTLQVVYQASKEVRSSIVFSTLIVCLVFFPLFALQGMEGKLFAPLGLAYIVSIAASLLVSLTVTPVLSYLLFSGQTQLSHAKDGPVLRGLKWLAERTIRFSLRFPYFNLACVAGAVAVAALFVAGLERDFLPPFNEGAIQLNVLLPPGTSLAVSNAVGKKVEQQLQQVEDVVRIARRTGRAELDEHADSVDTSEIIIELDGTSKRSRAAQIEDVRQAVAEFPGIVTAVEQPLAHLISDMLSGVKAQVAIKIYGDDLDLLRQTGQQMRTAIETVPGVKDLLVEQQALIPQLRIELRPEELARHGLTAGHVNRLIETALQGVVVSEVLDGQRTFDLIVRFDQVYREDLEVLRRLSIDLPNGEQVPLEAVAAIYESAGPNTIQREKVRRRIVLQCNVANRGVVDVVKEIQSRLKPLTAKLPAGYFVEYGGQFQSQQRASLVLGALFLLALAGVFLVLFTLFRSVNLSLQVMAALPMAFVGAVAAIVWTGQTLTIANLVGFISLAGIASRNGILLLNHYLHLVEHEGETWSQEMLVRAGLERLAPVFMTALTAGIGLIPLVLAAGEPGKEILFPVATVILGGVISSTLLDFLVHPALFWLFGIPAAKQALLAKANEATLD